jgi:myo-inositol-1(or 4)-monophosphatase
MTHLLPNDLPVELEAHAIDLARGAGAILRRYFGSPMEIEYKDKQKQDPVTTADKECQEYLTEAISSRYPDHGIVGEEDEESEDSVAPDLVWAVDPLDGTKNFLSGLPVFACSIGVLFRGVPIVGAVYIPWLTQVGGVVMHARTGGGAFLEQERVTVSGGDEPDGRRLIGLPESFSAAFRPGKSLRDNIGNVRVTGSIAYELAMTARGALQYSITTGPRLWDVAGGAVLVQEAGGAVMMGRRGGKSKAFGPATIEWEPLGSFIPTWRSGATTLHELRRWSSPLVSGSPAVARFVTKNIRRRSYLRHRLSRAVRRLQRPGVPDK